MAAIHINTTISQELYDRAKAVKLSWHEALSYGIRAKLEPQTPISELLATIDKLQRKITEVSGRTYETERKIGVLDEKVGLKDEKLP